MRPRNREGLGKRAPRPGIDRRSLARAEVAQRKLFLDGIARTQRVARKRMKELGIVSSSDLPLAMALLAHRRDRREFRETPAWQKVAAVLALSAVVEGCGDFTPWELKEPGSGDEEMADSLLPPDLTPPPPLPDFAVFLDGPDGGIPPDQNGDINGDANGDASEDGPTDGSDDKPDIPIIVMPDMAMEDTATLPDKAMEEPDLTTKLDQARELDLSIPPDQTMPPPDKAMQPPDQAQPIDQAIPPDLAKLPDLRPEPDLVPSPDLRQPPDLCGLITEYCEHIGVCGGEPTCPNGTDMKNPLFCDCRVNCSPDGSIPVRKCICSTPINEHCKPDSP